MSDEKDDINVPDIQDVSLTRSPTIYKDTTIATRYNDITEEEVRIFYKNEAEKLRHRCKEASYKRNNGAEIKEIRSKIAMLQELKRLEFSIFNIMDIKDVKALELKAVELMRKVKENGN